ncbi:MAG TPA: 50S ribosomal protein L11 methyltransferase [Steroidobacteraceae bacterium]|nr:50S ribosomal protein L11 methyltransferase [Steroidobacteraceae bacterium]
MRATVAVSFDLGALDPEGAESACLACGAAAVTLVDSRDDPVLEPLPGEVRLWPATRLSALFLDVSEPRSLAAAVAARLDLPPERVSAEVLPERAWEREWLKDFHAMRFGERLWVCPRHERVSDTGAVVVTLDPGLAFGTGTHPSTALCLEFLDAHLARGARAIDYGCGSGVLAIACARLGAAEVHCFDIDGQALIATRDNALENGVAGVVRIHQRAEALPTGVDVLLANILSGPLCTLAPSFAALVRPGGVAVLAGLMRHEVPDVTGAYAAWFDVAGCGESGDWACLSARRH